MAQAVVRFACVLVFAPFALAQTPSVPAPAPVAELLQQALQAYRTGKFDLAIEKYNNTLQQDAKSGDAYAGLARTFLKMEKIEAAFEAASKGVAQVPSSLPAHSALGEVYFRQARMEESEKEFLIGLNAPNPDARACLGLARLYDAYSFHARARKMLEKAHQLDPRDPDIHRRWIRTLKRSEQIALLEKYLEASTGDDEDVTYGLRTYLDVLKEREKQPRMSCRLVSKLTSTEAQLRPMLIDATHLHGFGLAVQVNGHSSKLLLDTGAGGILINKKLAENAGIEPVVTSKVWGIGDKGKVGAYLGYAHSIKVGDLEFQDCLVEVSEKRSVLNDDGLIGADVFSHYLVTIDFLWQKLKLQELPQRPGEKVATATLASQQQDDDEAQDSPADDNGRAKESSPADTKAPSAPPRAAVSSGPQDRYVAPEMQSFTKIFMIGHDLLIPTRVGNASSKLFLIDTGAMMNCISPQAAREVTKVHGDDLMHVRGISGSVKNVYSADKAVLQFSHFRQENEDITSFDLSHISKSSGTEVSGILGFTTLRMFTLKLDYRDGLVDFVYNGPKK